jgi:hypothetical protein
MMDGNDPIMPNPEMGKMHFDDIGAYLRLSKRPIFCGKI